MLFNILGRGNRRFYGSEAVLVVYVSKQSTPDSVVHLAEVISSPYATLKEGNPPLDSPHLLLEPSNSYINAN